MLYATNFNVTVCVLVHCHVSSCHSACGQEVLAACLHMPTWCTRIHGPAFARVPMLGLIFVPIDRRLGSYKRVKGRSHTVEKRKAAVWVDLRFFCYV